MATLPTESDLTGATRTNAQMRATHAQLRAYLAGMLGVDGTVPAALAALGVLASAGHVTRTSATTLTAADRGRVISATSGSWTLTLPGAAAAGAGWAVILRNAGTGTVSVARAGSDLIDGLSSVALLPGTAALVMSTGSAWVSIALGGVIGGPLRAPDGTAGAPGIAFGADPDTGLYRPAADQIALVTGGVQRALLSSAALQLDVPVTGAAVASSPTDITLGRVPVHMAYASQSGNGLPWGLGASHALNVPDNDANAIARSGFYRVGSANTVANVPDTGFGGVILHIPYSATYSAQTYIMTSGGTAGLMWIRHCNNGTWAAWRRVYTQADILGTVSQSGGVPMGALMQPGSAAQGRFRRTADGEMTCRYKLTTSASAGVVWTYPSAFAEEPVVTGTAIASEAVDVTLDAAPGTTTVTVSAWSRATGLRVAVPVCIKAEGRWSTMS